MGRKNDPHTTPHPTLAGRSMSGRIMSRKSDQVDNSPTQKRGTLAHPSKPEASKVKVKTVKKSPSHPGFKAVQQKIAQKEGVSTKAAGAILASSTRKASAGAKRKNPRLKRVKG